MGEYDISQWRLAGTLIHTPTDPKMATGVRTGFRLQTPPYGNKDSPGADTAGKTHQVFF